MTNLNKYILEFQRYGYLFIEILTITKRDVSLPVLNNFQERYLSYLQMKNIELDSINLVTDKIDVHLFETDRISIDPFFSEHQTRNRYIGLIQDVMNTGGSLVGLYLNNKIVGFFTYKIEPLGKVSFQLGAIFREHSNIGLGFFLNYFQILKAKQLGLKTIASAYSSNNVRARRVHENLNYVTDKQYYVFIKHINHL